MATALTTPAFRSLKAADAPELAALAAGLGGSETAAEWAALLARPATIGVAALSRDRIVGYAAGEVRAAFGLPAPAAWVEAFGIDLAERGRGLGRALLRELLDRFRDGGARHVYTVVPVHDRSMAPFFRQLGFRDEPLDCLGCDL